MVRKVIMIRKSSQCPWCLVSMTWTRVGFQCFNTECDEPEWNIRPCGCPEEHPEGHQEGCGLA